MGWAYRLMCGNMCNYFELWTIVGIFMDYWHYYCVAFSVYTAIVLWSEAWCQSSLWVWFVKLKFTESVQMEPCWNPDSTNVEHLFVGHGNCCQICENCVFLFFCGKTLCELWKNLIFNCNCDCEALVELWLSKLWNCDCQDCGFVIIETGIVIMEFLWNCDLCIDNCQLLVVLCVML